MRRSAVSHLRPDPAEHAASGSAVTGHGLVIGIEDVLYPAEQLEIVADPEGRAQVEQFVSVEPVGVGTIIPARTDDAQDRTTGLDLARRPNHFGTIYADWASAFGLGLGADLRIVGPSWDNGANTNRLDGYELLDLRASFGIGDNLELFGRVENVFDTDYRTVAGYGTAGRSVFGGIRAKM